MFFLTDIITYVRRLIKSPSDAVISDDLIIDYINRFLILDVNARIQLFDYKTTYTFQTTPGIDKYNMPFYSIQTQPVNNKISPIPVYQGFMEPCFINGVNASFYTQRESYYTLNPNYSQVIQAIGIGNGTVGPYTFYLSSFPMITGHVDSTGIISNYNYNPTNTPQDPPLVASGPSSNFLTHIPTTSVYSSVFLTATGANGQNIQVADSGQFLSNNTDGDLYGLLMSPGAAPFGNTALVGGYSTTLNTVNYTSGRVNVTFPTAIPLGTSITAKCYFYTEGLPRSVFWYNNTLTLRPCPNTQYTVELSAYLTPSAFLSLSNSTAFGYMFEYISRGAARKILLDTGDVEQFQLYEDEFINQQNDVHVRSLRQITSTPNPTIFNAQGGFASTNNGYGGL